MGFDRLGLLLPSLPLSESLRLLDSYAPTRPRDTATDRYSEWSARARRSDSNLGVALGLRPAIRWNDNGHIDERRQRGEG